MRVSTTTLLLLALAAPTSAQSADALLGAWQLDRETPQGTTSVPFVFSQAGDSIIVTVGEGENATSMGAVRFDGSTVTFAMDLRSILRRGMAGRAGGQRAGAGPPPEREARQGTAARSRGAAGGQAPEFTGTLEGTTITGVVATPRGEQQFVLRRVEGR